jgi:hypothetical protein
VIGSTIAATCWADIMFSVADAAARWSTGEGA